MADAGLPARLPPLLTVRAFEAVGRTGSMRKAADDIGVSHTVVSRHVKNLEAWLGTKLLMRTARGASLTQDGRQFLDAATAAFALIADAARELRPGSRRSILRLWSMPGFAARWLTPRLSALESALPGIDIVLRASDELPDFSRFEADVMIRFGEAGEMPGGATELVTPRMFPVASPQWLAANAAPATLAAMALCPLIHEESRTQWQRWFELAGVALTRPLTGPRLGNAGLSVDAAIAGQGIALASRLTAADAIAAGRLTELFATDIRVGGYFLIASPERGNERLVSRFRKWISAELDRAEAD